MGGAGRGGHGRRAFGLARRPHTFGEGRKAPPSPARWVGEGGHPPPDAKIALGRSHGMRAAEMRGRKHGHGAGERGRGGGGGEGALRGAACEGEVGPGEPGRVNIFIF